MLKCIILIVGKGKSGAPRRLTLLANSLNEQGINTSIVSHRGHPINQLAQELEIPIILTLNSSPQWFHKLPSTTRKLLTMLITNLSAVRLMFSRKFKPDVIVMRGSKSGLLSFPMYLIPKVIRILDIDYEDRPTFMIDLSREISIRRSHAITLQYEGVIRDFFGRNHQNLMKAKSHVIMPGIQLDKLRKFRKVYNQKLTSSSFRIIHVGKVHRRKNQLLALKAIDYLINHLRHRDIFCTFAGGIADCDYNNVLKSFIKKHNLSQHVEFIGWTDHLPQLIADHDLVLITSTNEGVPNTAQEAMTLGIPIVCNLAGGLPDIVRHGETGLIVDSNEPSDWASTISRLYRDENLRKCITVNQIHYSETNFDHHKFGLDYSRLIRNLAG